MQFLQKFTVVVLMIAFASGGTYGYVEEECGNDIYKDTEDGVLDGYILLNDGLNDKCFKSFSQEETWSNAESICKKEGGHLASVHDRYFLGSHLIEIMHGGWETREVWLGVRAGSRKWSDGSSIDYVGDLEGFPGDNECIVSLDYETWAPRDCDNTYPFACTKPPASSPSS